MGKEIKDGGPAFPGSKPAYIAQADAEGMLRLVPEGGMSLRDYFAAAAMQGLISGPHEPFKWGYEERAKWAYANADAMLEARNK